MTTSETRTAPAPIIVGALENAGTMAQRVAQSILRSGAYSRYARNEYALLACALTDALGYDCFGVWRINDTDVSADNGYSVEARRHAAQRRDWRTRLADQIARLDDAAFAHLVAVLADGRGHVEAARWRSAAIDAADGYDVAS